MSSDARNTGGINMDRVRDEPASTFADAFDHDGSSATRQRMDLEVLETNLTGPSRSTDAVKARDSQDVGLRDSRRVERAELDSDESCTNASVTIAICAQHTSGKERKSCSIKA
jgi:hypothetical protein